MEKHKLTYIHQKLNLYAERFPQFIDPSIFKDRDRFLAYHDPDFVEKRTAIHLLRILISQHLQKKKLLGNYSPYHKKRAVEFRIIPGKVHYPFGSKKILGILVQLSLGDRYELFDEEIFQRAVHRLLPNLIMVKGSLYKFQSNHDNVRTWYAEFEEAGHQSFSLVEISILKNFLGKELLERIERLVPYVFKIRNQEEVLRNILTLSQEIDHVLDLPQVMISFETQNSEEVMFTVICVRAEDQFSTSLEHLIQHNNASCQWVLERKQNVRYVGNHQPVIAYLFRVILIPDSEILRNDGSLNFFAARQRVANSLKAFTEEYRDFNGGILIKQEETLLALRNAFPHIAPEQIENIFYSITPIEMQAILPISILQTIVDLTYQTSQLALTNAHDYHLVSSAKPPHHIVLLNVAHGPLEEKAKEHLQMIEFPENIQAFFSLSNSKSHLFGFLLSLDNKKFNDRFVEAMSNLMVYWSHEAKQLKVLRISLNNPIISLDPRIGADAISSIFVKMLFEGLVRKGSDGKIENGIADKIDISEDGHTYWFHLKPTFWSNGNPLTSYDFEYAWKKILSPDFKSPFNYYLFSIKNAEKAKNGLLPMEEVGIQSINDKLLKVELSSISPDFLELLSLPIFSPVHSTHDIHFPNWPVEEGHRFICNGAFKIEKNLQESGLIFTNNPLYWEKNRIQLDRIAVTPSYLAETPETVLQNQIHWIGHPFENSQKTFKPGPQDEIIRYPDNGLYWAVCQTHHPLLKNKKIRQALSYAIDRQALLELLQYKNDSAFSPLPQMHSQMTENPYPFSCEKAQQLWKEGLEELGLLPEQIPTLEILYTVRTHFGKQTAEFLCRTWHEIIGVECRIQGCDFKTLLNRLVTKNYNIGLIRWLPWIDDPFYTLNAFVTPESPFSVDSSLDKKFMEITQKAQIEKNSSKRKEWVKQIEEILVDEQPIIPLFNTYSSSMKKKYLTIHFNHTLLDFKWARFENDT